MLAVARANACRWCTLAHRQWALAEGVTDAELAALEDQRPEQFDRRTWAAIAWAQARAHADLGPAPIEFEDELARHYSQTEREDLDLVTTLMTIANRSANTFDALLARLRGHPVPGSRLLDELLVGTSVAVSIPAVAGYLALARRRGRRSAGTRAALDRALSGKARCRPRASRPCQGRPRRYRMDMSRSRARVTANGHSGPSRDRCDRLL